MKQLKILNEDFFDDNDIDVDATLKFISYSVIHSFIKIRNVLNHIN